MPPRIYKDDDPAVFVVMKNTKDKAIGPENKLLLDSLEYDDIYDKVVLVGRGFSCIPKEVILPRQYGLVRVLV